MSRRRGPGAARGGQPAAKKADERVDAKQKDESERMQKVPDEMKAQACPVSHNNGGEQGDLPEAVLSEADYSEVDEIPERLFRCFFSQRTDMQAFVGTMRLFQNASDKAMQRIHHLVITMLLDDFQSFPYWPEKELLMVGELLGQFIRWDLIPDGGPLQLALCCILSALKEPPASLLYRFGQRAVEQFLCRFAHHDVASQICRQMQLSQRPTHEEEKVKQEERRLHVNPVNPVSPVNPMNPVMFPAQPTVFFPWPLLPGLNHQHLLMHMLIPQACHGVPSSSRPHHTGRVEGPRRVSQQEFPKWVLGNTSKAASRPAGSKQGILGWQEPEKEKREKEKDAGTKSKKKASAKNKKASAGQNAGTTPLPSFVEVDMESMEFQLPAEDVCNMKEENKEDTTGDVHP